MTLNERITLSANTIRNLIIGQVVLGGLTTFASAGVVANVADPKIVGVVIAGLGSLTSIVGGLLSRATGQAAMQAAEAVEEARELPPHLTR